MIACVLLSFCAFYVQLSANFPNFCGLSLNLENSFFRFAKTLKIGVSAKFCVFLVEKQKNRQNTMGTGVSGFGFCPKLAIL